MNMKYDDGVYGLKYASAYAHAVGERWKDDDGWMQNGIPNLLYL